MESESTAPHFSPDDLDLELDDPSHECGHDGCSEPAAQVLAVGGSPKPLCDAHADEVITAAFLGN